MIIYQKITYEVYRYNAFVVLIKQIKQSFINMSLALI